MSQQRRQHYSHQPSGNIRRPRPANKKKSRFPATGLLVFIVFVITVLANMPNISRSYIYPMDYNNYVERYSKKFGVDRNLIYAVIKTESNFDPQAESDVGARGLMQLMEDAFDWVKYRMNDEREITYDNMYDPEYNIEYGTYLLMLLCDEYDCVETAIAAYHTGRGNVNKWLDDPSYSHDGKALYDMPSSVTKHYVNKVMSAYDAYENLYKDII